MRNKLSWCLVIAFLGMMTKVVQAAAMHCLYLSTTEDSYTCPSYGNAPGGGRGNYEACDEHSGYIFLGGHDNYDICNAAGAKINYNDYQFCGSLGLLGGVKCTRVKQGTTECNLEKGYSTPYPTKSECESDVARIRDGRVFCLYKPTTLESAYEAFCLEKTGWRDGIADSIICPSQENYGAGVVYQDETSCETARADAEATRVKPLWCGSYDSVPVAGGNYVNCYEVDPKTTECPKGGSPYQSENECREAIAKEVGFINGCCIQKTQGVWGQPAKYSCQCGTQLSGDGKCPNGSQPYSEDQKTVCETDAKRATEDARSPENKPPFTIPIKVGSLDDETLNDMNPLKHSNVFNDPANRNPGYIMSRLLETVIFPLMAFILFVMLVWGGNKIVQGSFMGNQSSIELGRRRIVAAVIGFILLFASYWLWSMVERALGLS